MGFAVCLPLDDPNNPYKYCPSAPAAIILFVLFAGSTIFHLYQAITYRKAFCWVLIMGGLWETLSFAARVLSIHNPSQKGTYDASFLLLILSPLLINAFDYMLLGRMVTFYLSEDKLVGIKGSKMGVIFVCFDILSFIIQIGGGLMSISKTANTATLGLHVYMGGVIFQQLVIACFFMLTVAFQRKLKYDVNDRSSRRGAEILLLVLRGSLALITFRIIFRIVQFSAPFGSSLSTYINHHEFFTYVFDAVPMFLSLLLMNIWHPGKILVEGKGKGKGYSRGVSEERVLGDWAPNNGQREGN